MLLVLAVVWGVVLVSWLRSRAQTSFGDPVGTFRRHLTVLERTAPSVFPAANRLRPARQSQAGGAIPPYRGAIPGQGYARRPVRPSSAMSTSAASYRRSQSRKRRRDVLFALVVSVIGSIILAAATGMRVMIYVQVISDLLFVGYIALLVRMRNLAAERELKLTYLRDRPSLPSRRRPAALGYAAGGYDVSGYNAGDYDDGGYGVGSYGDLVARRVAGN